MGGLRFGVFPLALPAYSDLLRSVFSPPRCPHLVPQKHFRTTNRAGRSPANPYCMTRKPGQLKHTSPESSNRFRNKFNGRGFFEQELDRVSLEIHEVFEQELGRVSPEIHEERKPLNISLVEVPSLIAKFT